MGKTVVSGRIDQEAVSEQIKGILFYLNNFLAVAQFDDELLLLVHSYCNAAIYLKTIFTVSCEGNNVLVYIKCCFNQC